MTYSTKRKTVTQSIVHVSPIHAFDTNKELDESLKGVCNKKIKMDGNDEVPVQSAATNGRHDGECNMLVNGENTCNAIDGVLDDEKYEGVPKKEFIILLLQSLDGLGYKKTKKLLEMESGTSLEAPELPQLHEAMLVGDWDRVLEVLKNLPLHELVAKACTFLILEQKFLELMHQQRIGEAVECLRGEFRCSCFDEDTRARLKACCNFLMCQNSDDLQRRSEWKNEGSREALWKKLQELFPPDVIPPPNRLISIIHQAWKLQELHCLYHAASTPSEAPPLCSNKDCTTEDTVADNTVSSDSVAEPSSSVTSPSHPSSTLKDFVGNISSRGYALLYDHECPKGALPVNRVATLESHTNEVWDVALSHNEKYIASASKDGCIILWEATPPFKKVQVWDTFCAAIRCIAWSPDDKYLASGSSDSSIVIWTPNSNVYKWRFTLHQSSVASVCWLPDSRQLLSAEVEKKMKLWKIPTLHSLSEIVFDWDFGYRLHDCVVTYNGKHAIVVTADESIHIINLQTADEVWCLSEADTIASITTSSISEQFLVNCTEPKTEILLWDLNMKHLVQKYVGHKRNKFAVSAAFGGPNEAYVICGSGDSMIYIWQRYRGSLLEVIPGHTYTVNVVIWPWSSSFPLMISASDDNTVALWHCHEQYKVDGTSTANGELNQTSITASGDESAALSADSTWAAIAGTRSGVRSC